MLDACLLMERHLHFYHPNLKVFLSLSMVTSIVLSRIRFWFRLTLLSEAGRFVRMFLGPVNVRALRKDVQLKVKEEYNSYRVSIFVACMWPSISNVLLIL